MTSPRLGSVSNLSVVNHATGDEFTIEVTDQAVILFAVRDETGPWQTFSLTPDVADSLATLLVAAAGSSAVIRASEPIEQPRPPQHDPSRTPAGDQSFFRGK